MDDRDWRRESSNKILREHYYDPKLFRKPQGYQGSSRSVGWGSIVFLLTFPYVFYIAAGTLWGLFHGQHSLAALKSSYELITGVVAAHPIFFACLSAAVVFIFIVGEKIPSTFRFLGLIPVLAFYGALIFYTYKGLGGGLDIRRTHDAQDGSNIARTVARKNALGQYEILGAINGNSLTFVIDTGAGITSVPGSMATKLGVKSCRPSEFVTAGGKTFGCIATVPELEFGSFRVKNVDVALMPNMQGDALLGMNVLGMVKMEQKGSDLSLTTSSFVVD